MSTQEIKGNLARLLATENLIVEHRKVPTASFDVDRRVLTLPNWDRASSVVYDLLVGHEVGHALFTPNEDWRDAATCPRDYINVVEDARIEKLMKRKYPGLRKSFAGGYAELNSQDFFGTEGSDPKEFSLIDRINLHFKIGANSFMPFASDELVFVVRIEQAETFNEVCQIASDIYSFVKNSQEESIANINANEENNANENDSVGEKSESSSELEQDRKESDDMEDSDRSGNATPPSLSDDMDMEFADDEDETSKTQQAFDSASNQLTDIHSKTVNYIELPESIDLDNIVVDWKEVHDWIEHEYSSIDESRLEIHNNYIDRAKKEYREFRSQSQKEVNYLVKEFECRKSADAYARAGQSKTGVLDTTKLHTYKYNDDIFKKVTVLPDGKNHGLLFLLDWSGSMVNQIHSTFKQLLNLTAFCKKVQIPFEVYAFTNDWRIVNYMKDNNLKEVSDRYDFAEYNRSPKREFASGEVSISSEYFNLVNIVSSRSNTRDYERQCSNIWGITYAYDRSISSCVKIPHGLDLSGTPLNEAVACMNYIVPVFKKQTNVQKVNVCILSDGDSCMTGYGRSTFDQYTEEERVYRARIGYGQSLRDRKTGRIYPMFQDSFHSVTNTFVKQLRHRFPEVNVLGFRIMSGSHLLNFVTNYGQGYDGYDKISAKWKKEKSVVIPNPLSYSAIFAIQQNNLESDTEFNVESGAKKGEITRAFKKMLNNKTTNKKLLNSFVEYIA